MTKGIHIGPHVGLMTGGFDPVNGEEIIDVDIIEFEAFKAPFDGLFNQTGDGS